MILAVGSTLSVYPAAALVPAAKRRGARVVIVNAEPTGYDLVADAVVRTPISESLPLIVATSPPGGDRRVQDSRPLRTGGAAFFSGAERTTRC